MSVMNPNAFHCFGTVSGTDGVAYASGCAIARSSTGVYTITPDEAVDSTECTVLVTLRGATSGMVRVVQTSDTVKTVNCFTVDGTTAADRDFDFCVLRAPG